MNRYNKQASELFAGTTNIRRKRMSSREIVLRLDERWYDALERHIKGETLQKKLENYLADLRLELLPINEMAQINKEIREERMEQEKYREANRRFAVFKVTEHNEQTLFLVDEPIDFLRAASSLRSYLLNNKSAYDFRHYYAAAQKISAGEFERYTKERVENTGRVCGAFEINFDRGEMAGLKIDEGWTWFKLRDVSAAAYQAERKSGLESEERWQRFLAALDGKEITPDVSLRGARRLRPEEVSFFGEIIESNLRLNFYMDSFGGVDEVFGTHVCTTENCDYLNVYADYDLISGEVENKLLVTICRENGCNDDREYHLSKKERQMLLEKMDAYCQHETGMTLSAYREQLLSENEEPSMEVPLM